MPKETRVHRFSSNFSRSSPYPCSSNDLKHVEFDRELGSPEDVKQWEEARCPICLDHPHNAVLLRCSSLENGCRPYVCNTGVHHSNCLEQFCKLLASSPPMRMRLPEISSVTGRRRRLPWPSRAHESELLPELHCPLCRGEIHGWSVVEAARKFMNYKSRNCSCETCDFVGNFAELRRHARSEHPFARPSEADPERQRNWVQMEHQRNFADLISMSLDHSQNDLGDEEDFEDLSIDDVEEVELPSMNDEEEEQEERVVDNLNSAYFVFRYVTESSVPTNAFRITMNTANGDFRHNNSNRRNILPAMSGRTDNPRYATLIGIQNNFRQNNSNRRNILPAMSDRRDNPRYATLIGRQNIDVRSFTERVLRQSSRDAVRRQPGTTTRQTPPRGQQFA